MATTAASAGAAPPNYRPAANYAEPHWVPKGTVFYQHPVIQGGVVNTSTMSVPKDPRPLRMVKLGELFNWFEAKRLSPIHLQYAHRRFHARNNTLYQYPGFRFARAARLMRFMPLILVTQAIYHSREGGDFDCYRKAKYH